MKTFEDEKLEHVVVLKGKNAPAVDAFVMGTVWNHIGKKYMMEKLHIATRKFEQPTSTGILCLSKNRAKTGSGEIKSSAIRKAIANTPAHVMDAITEG